MFQGFSQGAIDFLWGIRFNNERGWFLAHKEEFLTLVDAPMRELAAQVSQAMTEEFPKLGLELKVSRIYRDARRLFGRGPYPSAAGTRTRGRSPASTLRSPRSITAMAWEPGICLR